MHCAGNILDLIYTEVLSEVKEIRCQVGDYISDHCLVTCDLHILKPKIQCKTITVRKLSNIVDEDLLSMFNQDNVDVSENLLRYSNFSRNRI